MRVFHAQCQNRFLDLLLVSSAASFAALVCTYIERELRLNDDRDDDMHDIHDWFLAVLFCVTLTGIWHVAWVDLFISSSSF